MGQKPTETGPIVDESTIEKLYILVQDIADEDWYDSDKHQKALELIESMMGAWE